MVTHFHKKYFCVLQCSTVRLENMPIGARRLVKSTANGRLIDAAVGFVSSHAETLLLAPTHSAGEEVAHRTPGIVGVHRMTLVQVAADLARPSIARLGLAPLTALCLEALAVRVVYAPRAQKELRYFEPVAAFPRFARALSRTIGELRLAPADPAALASPTRPGPCLGRSLWRC